MCMRLSEATPACIGAGGGVEFAASFGQADAHAMALKFEEVLRRVFLTRSMDFVNDDVLTTVQPVNFV